MRAQSRYRIVIVDAIDRVNRRATRCRPCNTAHNRADDRADWSDCGTGYRARDRAPAPPSAAPY